MNKLKKYIVLTMLMMILFVLGTSAFNKVNGNGKIEGAPGVGWSESLVGNWCCQKDTALWSPNIEEEYKKWYFSSLPYRRNERNRKYRD